MNSRINIVQLMAVAILASVVFFAACTKEKSNDSPAQEEEVSVASSQSDAEAETVFNSTFDDVMGVNDDVGMSGTGVFGRNGFGRENGCFTVTVTHPNASSFFPAKVVIDFGTSGCMGNDGHKRRGKIITEYTNRLIIPGAIATTTFDGFYVDSTKVEGTHVITNTSSAANTQPPSRSFKVTVTNAKLTKASGNYIEWNSTKTITQIEGLATPNIAADDYFKIEGSSRGRVLRNGILVGWESSITEPLIKKFLCRWIVKGVVKTVRVSSNTSNQWVAVLNFGAGTCDNKAIITINGVTREITLP